MDHAVKLWHIGPGTEVHENIVESMEGKKKTLSTVEMHFPVCHSRDQHTVQKFLKLIFQVFL